MQDSKSSFTAADAFPVKLLQNASLVKSIAENRIIPPLHVQLIPTNKCNLHCSFCSCAEEDRSKEMTPVEMAKNIQTLWHLGMKSVTITGGGDPLMYPHLDRMLDNLECRKVKIGLVTNGLLLHTISIASLNKITWCRISHGDDRAFNANYKDQLLRVMNQAYKVDWAFSYVVSKTPNVEQIKDVILFAAKMGCTHVRLVADLLCPEAVPMVKLQKQLHSILPKTMPVIFQERDIPEQGKNCRICYLKPVVTPDSKVYACCGAQYALDPPSKAFPEELCLGTVKEFKKIINEQSSKPFAGAKHCKRCYYGAYNRALQMLLSETVHREFV